jgi:hypothetical protein
MGKSEKKKVKGEEQGDGEFAGRLMNGLARNCISAV